MTFDGKPPGTSQTPSATGPTLGLKSERVIRVRALNAPSSPARRRCRAAAAARSAGRTACRRSRRRSAGSARSRRSSRSKPSSSMRAPVGSTPWNGPPQKVPVARHRTAAWLRAATRSSTSKFRSGIAAKSSEKNARIPSGTGSSPTVSMWSIPPGAQHSSMRRGRARRARRNTLGRPSRGPASCGLLAYGRLRGLFGG